MMFRPRVSGVLGVSSEADPRGHLDQRHEPFTHPMENAMSPEQFERLTEYLDKAGEGLQAAADAKTEIDRLNALVQQTVADKDRMEAELKAKAAALDAAQADAISKGAALESVESALNEAKAALDEKTAALAAATEEIEELRTAPDKLGADQ